MLKFTAERSQTGIVLQTLVASCPTGILAYILNTQSVVYRSQYRITGRMSQSTQSTSDEQPVASDSYVTEETNSIISRNNQHESPLDPLLAVYDQPYVNYWASNVNITKTNQLKSLMNKEHTIEQLYINMVREDIRSAAPIRNSPAAQAAIQLEIKQLIDQEVFQPIYEHEINPNIQIIPSQMLLKEKYLPDGSLDKVKARLVAGGHKQQSIDSSQRYAPTTSFTNVLLNLNIASYKQNKISTIDIKGAYLHAQLNNVIYMTLNKSIAKQLISLYPQFAKYLLPNGSIIVMLQKSLYGLKEAANLWYNHISNTLKEMGLISNQYDPCLFHGTIASDHVLLNLHVDDMLTSYHHDSTIHYIKKKLLEKYDDITLHTGTNLNFLGINIIQSDDLSRISLSQKGYINNLLDKFAITEISEYPSPLSFNENLNAASEAYHNVSQYCSVITSLLYLAQRTRPDILKEVILLSTKNQAPTNINYDQAIKILRYIKNTHQLSLDICCRNLEIIVYADASFKSHFDRKSHTGGAIYIGNDNSAIKCISKRQSITSLSSFEAELIAISDVFKHAKLIHNTISNIFPNVPPMTWYCDNTSVISSLTNQQPTSISNSHIDVKYFHLREQIMNQSIIINYTPTDKMKADMLTKPIVGPIFNDKRWWLLSPS